MIFSKKDEKDNKANSDIDSMALNSNDNNDIIDNPKSEKELEEEKNRQKYIQMAKLPPSKSKVLLVHIMQNGNHEIATVKTKIYAQEVTWQKRLWPIDHTAFVIDKKGIANFYIDVNESTGALRFQKSYIDKCVQCGNKIGQDAVNTRDLLKRKTITAIWGIDSTHIMLLLILGIALLIMGVAVLYMYGENQKLTSKLATLVPTPPPSTNPASLPAHLILPLLGGIAHVQ